MEESELKAYVHRWAVLQAAVATGGGAALLSALYVGAGLVPQEQVTPEREPVAPGDLIVYAQGDRAGQPVNASDLEPGQRQVIAYPMNPQTRVVKGEEPANTLLLLRLEAASLTAETARHAAGGVVAYSGVCTHLGCIVSNWIADKQLLFCPCHGAQYDPRDRAKPLVVAPKPLPQLPIRVEDGVLVVAGEFQGPVGPPT
ncbi:ubiquinol-cytochrome c reductase iron-sulfur subunit [Calidithermus chliarophilus]|uniref:QcrA and Rieske domain-containing protein n=1 Tax=Calidithermus chliarophilus TaxID=52023 RepID=UPI000420A27C|nr:ubiquinol-cytochrome c reductase iron-sulfur subunit [Calidithermus chliarophilus]